MPNKEISFQSSDVDAFAALLLNNAFVTTQDAQAVLVALDGDHSEESKDLERLGLARYIMETNDETVVNALVNNLLHGDVVPGNGYAVREFYKRWESRWASLSSQEKNKAVSGEL